MLSEKQFHGFRLGLAATTDSRTARGSRTRDGTSCATVNFTSSPISADIGSEFTKLVRNFHLIYITINTVCCILYRRTHAKKTAFSCSDLNSYLSYIFFFVSIYISCFIYSY